jgi:hypothetical protein
MYLMCVMPMLLLLGLLQVQSSGLSAKADNVASWKQQLSTWQGSIQDRCGLAPSISADASKQCWTAKNFCALWPATACAAICAWLSATADANGLRVAIDSANAAALCWQVALFDSLLAVNSCWSSYQQQEYLTLLYF